MLNIDSIEIIKKIPEFAPVRVAEKRIVPEKRMSPRNIGIKNTELTIDAMTGSQPMSVKELAKITKLTHAGQRSVLSRMKDNGLVSFEKRKSGLRKRDVTYFALISNYD